MAEGWIKLHRKLMENPLYFSEPFTKCQAWIDLLLLANMKDGFFFKRGIKVDVKRGQIGYDIESLAKRWMWSRGKVERFISILESDYQVVRQKSNVTTLISIVNFNSYQENSKPNDTPNSKPNGHQTINQTVNQTDTNKNEKKVKNDKNDKKEESNTPPHPDFLKFNLWLNENCPRVLQLKTQIVEKEFLTLKKTYTTEQLTKVLLDMENYKKLTTNYVSAYLTLTKWLKKEFDGKFTPIIPGNGGATGRNAASERRTSVATAKGLATTVLLGFATEETGGRV